MDKIRLIEIAEYVAAVNAISKAAALNIVTDTFKFIADELKAGKEIQIHSLGKFSPAVQAERTAMNLNTGQKMQIPARRIVKFKVSPTLKEAMRAGEPE